MTYTHPTLVCVFNDHWSVSWFFIFVLCHVKTKAENSKMSGAIIPIVTRISSSIIRILGCNPGPMTLQGTNTYLLGTGEKWDIIFYILNCARFWLFTNSCRRILLDTGDSNKALFIENLKNVLNSEKASIETILLTHWHHDHIGGVTDVLNILDASAKCKVWKYPRTDAPDVYDEIPKSLELHKLSNGQEFTVNGASVKVIYTPGHTTDHVVLTLKEDNSLFSGDCILGILVYLWCIRFDILLIAPMTHRWRNSCFRRSLRLYEKS